MLPCGPLIDAAKRAGGLKTGMGEFFNMGGYAAYVWPAYAVSALALGGLVIFILRRGKRLRERLEKAEAARRNGKAK